MVVAIVVDQFRFDFLGRFKDSFGSGGVRGLMDHGAFFANANYIYVPTYTGPARRHFHRLRSGLQWNRWQFVT
jgi:hypothetical protein